VVETILAPAHAHTFETLLNHTITTQPPSSQTWIPRSAKRVNKLTASAADMRGEGV
jgi:hypothetical protein